MPLLRRKAKSAGFTFVEIMVVVTVFSGVMAALFVSLLTTRNSQAFSSASVYVQQEARRAFDAIVREFHESGRIRRAGDLVGNADFTGQTQVDFQIARSYDAAACGGTCWGDDTTNDRWLHYLLNVVSAENTQLIRCSTANQADAVTVSGCRVLANNVQTFTVDYSHVNRRLTVRLDVRKISSQLAGGSVAAGPSTLISEIELRNNGA